MDIVLLDTTIASLLHPKKKNSILFPLYEPHMRGNILAISFQTVAELWAWPITNNWSLRHQEEFNDFLEKFLVIPYTLSLAKIWATVGAKFRQHGRRLEAGDAWIIATAIQRKILLLTHDKDYLGIELPGLKILSYAE